ncbi:alkaline phosphatase family protein [Chryseobacterium indologenes]|uniref:alkaline phosphatase family protein n=1 Tax=Chryseobacterium indologenes TaxID=253 RepID=UPI000BFCC595|nr:ectonucleotide pyrophosphatase/phosphodiesterase [Chryseobacterium indologenes]ATN06612.1 alkaline phosphatase family protein [Chryseobacterium indologenes]AYY84627.1 alkaline phosphatase family protein [Chryseobacterium indologenes]QIX81508.1 alkaline phosphatase family protein [Chryseobacterium indologenes]UDQ55263.1 ectonucleotide pyrophosphatase/phosphodiesterase [Chryseobacterium indologenes]VFA42310.1 Phosphonoacetate hydrolase [Chryseobacterium indologenes]
MKRGLHFLLLLLSFTVFAQQPVIDTAQVVVPGRHNSLEAQSKPYVIMISTDGFRYDYAKKYNAEHLLKLSGNGVQAKAMIPSYPSITFPNHWSLITGLYPSHHGLIDNFFYDYKKNEAYAMSNKKNAEDGSWYGGIPLWGLAEKQGMVSASLMWVGSASDAGGIRPSYYYPYHEKFTPSEKVEKVVNWLKLPEDKRPHFISLYFPEVDGSGHHFGPDSKETETAVHLIDNAIGDLVQKVSDLGLKNVNFVFVSDHGMIKVDGGAPLEIPALLLDKNRFDFYNSQTLLRVFVKNPDEVKSVYKELKAHKTDDYEVYLDKRLPKYLHFATRDDQYNRIGQILLLPKAPKIFLEKGKKSSVGKHGYNPRVVPEMKATFYAWGPEFKNHIAIDEFNNINVYPMVAEVLGLKIDQPIDGKQKVLRGILKEK